jgi:Flp pilus assembly protein CpaB
MHSKLTLTSIAFGVLAFVALRLHLDRLEARITGGAMARVLVLTSDLPAGTAITRDVVSSRELPQLFRESRHIVASELDQIVGVQLAVSGRANETLQWTDLASMRPKLRQLSSLIPHGMRAMTLQAPGLAPDALLTPGDRVDVFRVGPAHGEIVLQDAVVLAVGDDIGGVSPTARRTKSSGGRSSITLSVTLEQSRALAQAEQLGPLRFVMRNPDDVALDSAGQRVAYDGENAP